MKALLLIAAGLFAGQAISQVTIGNTTVQVDTVAEGLATPWEIRWGDDDQLWLTEKDGYVSKIDPETGQRTVLLDITSQVEVQGESGLLGMSDLMASSDVPSSDVFLVYTYMDGGSFFEKLVKYTYDGVGLVNEEVLIDSIPANSFHNGSRLIRLEDNTLLMSTGDAGDADAAQDTTSLSGKILRVGLDGEVPVDNPIPGSYVYSYGHRNPQGILVHPNGHIYISEHGPDSDDEFQMLLSGRNYGWPEVLGFCDDASETAFCSDNDIVEPLYAWTPTIAPSDLIYYQNPGLPEFHNKVIMAVLKDEMMVALELNEDGDTVLNAMEYLNNQFGRIRDLCVGPEGEIYFLANNNSGNQQILVLKPDYLLGMDDVSNQKAVKLYPNPAENRLFIKGDLSDYSIEICDNAGRMVYAGQIGLQGIDISSLPNGHYLVHIQEGGYNRTLSFVKR